ncbi:MAG: YggS family pyridoxal phosphate-dependent enzyme [Chitinophagaceae bacterium]|jgi:pyridoxal phosphate enzyme (YggS family)
MPVQPELFFKLKEEINASGATLVAVSKKKSVEEIKALYDLGQRDFGENYVQELLQKQPLLPADIRWHFIGHLQRNKVKSILPFCKLIQGVDRLELLEEINKQASKLERVVDCLLQVHIATEESKFGFDSAELSAVLPVLSSYSHVRVVGLMGMASFTNNLSQVSAEFRLLKKLFDQYRSYFLITDPFLSMGMSGDYKIALEEGSTMIRIGSLLFGARQ